MVTRAVKQKLPVRPAPQARRTARQRGTGGVKNWAKPNSESILPGAPFPKSLAEGFVKW